jgi:two-component system, NtrC family, response regulator AtoC
MSLPDGSSLDLLEEVRQAGKPGEWVLLTAYGSVPDSVRAMQLGALDFLEKPCSTQRLGVVVERCTTRGTGAVAPAPAVGGRRAAVPPGGLSSAAAR